MYIEEKVEQWEKTNLSNVLDWALKKEPVESKEDIEDKEAMVMTEREKLIQSQIDFCKEKGVPMFAPANGRCFFCERDMVNDSWSNEHITGCPHCHHSYCE